MSRKKTPAPVRKPTRARWPVAAAGAIAAVMIACAALAATASVPIAPSAAPETAGPASAQVAPPPVPALGEPYLADLGGGRFAKITIKTAVFTSPAVLTLDVDWDSWVGATTPSPADLQVLDGTGARARVHELPAGALPTVPVQPGSPVHGKVAFDIPAGPATLVITPAGTQTATRITVKG